MQMLLSSCVFMMMLCIGLDFCWPQWLRLLRAPRPIVVGLIAQNVGVPVMAYGVAWCFRASPEVALALILIVASPGGPVANAIVHHVGARTDLSVSLTAINGVLCLLTAPLIADLGFVLVTGLDSGLKLPLAATLTHLATIIALPIALGGILNTLLPSVVRRLLGVTRQLTLILLLGTLLLVFVLNVERIQANFQAALLALFLLSALMVAMGMLCSRLGKLTDDFGFAIASEVSVHNVPLALLMANGLLQRPELSSVIVLYVPVILVVSILNAVLYRRQLGYQAL